MRPWVRHGGASCLRRFRVPNGAGLRSWARSPTSGQRSPCDATPVRPSSLPDRRGDFSCRVGRSTSLRHFRNGDDGPELLANRLIIENISSIRAEAVALTVDVVDIVSAAGGPLFRYGTSGRRPHRAPDRASGLIAARRLSETPLSQRHPAARTPGLFHFAPFAILSWDRLVLCARSNWFDHRARHWDTHEPARLSSIRPHHPPTHRFFHFKFPSSASLLIIPALHRLCTVFSSSRFASQSITTPACTAADETLYAARSDA